MEEKPTHEQQQQGIAEIYQVPTVHYTVQDHVPYLTEPGIALVGQTHIYQEQMRPFLQGFDANLVFEDYLADGHHALSEGVQGVKAAGQLCYMSFGPKRTRNADAQKYITHLLEQGHLSVFEHVSYSFLLWGISRSLTHEMVRHRHLSFSQVSQRYVGARTLRFVERPEFQVDATLHGAFQTRIELLMQEYRSHQEYASACLPETKDTTQRKEINQMARAILPNEVEAPLIVTGNARAWRNFLLTRGTIAAEPEIRRLALLLFSQLFRVDTLLFDDITVGGVLDEGANEVGSLFFLQSPYPH